MTTEGPVDLSPAEPPNVFNSLVGAAALIAVVTVVARVVGFARIVVFARTVGPATCLGNAYFTSNTVPNIVFEIVAGGALASLVVPVLAGPAADGNRLETSHTVSALLTWTVLILTPIAVIGIWLVHPVMHALVGDSGRCDTAAVTSTGARMLLVFLPQIVLYGVGIVLAGTLQAHRRFVGPAMAPLLSSLVVIATYLTFAAVFSGDPNNLGGVHRSDELILSVGTTVGVAVLSLSLLVPLRRARVGIRPSLRFPPGIARRVQALALAGVATLFAQEAAVAVVLRLANDDGPRGSVTVYNLAWTVFLLPWAVLAVPIATSAFPRMSAAASVDDLALFAETTRRATRAVIVVTCGAAAVMVATAEPIATVLVKHGPGATAGDVHALSRAIAAFAPGLVGYGLVATLGRALYAEGRGRAAAGATAIGWFAVIGADLLFVSLSRQADSVPALAAGNSVGMTVAGVLLVYAFTRGTPHALRSVGRSTCVATAAGVVAGALGLAVVAALGSTSVPMSIAAGLLAAAICVVTFGVVVAVADREAVRDLRDRAAGHA
ncbi:MAG: murein biosynthesis integral membrane protein MurJ [Actinomycetes bacterium]